MGRPKTYDPDALVDRAMELFWLRGFHDTSTAALVEHLGINKFSLYAEWGSKQGLYEAALARYDRDVVFRHFGRLEQPDAGLAQIRDVFELFASSGRSRNSERGCLMCNAATERGPHDPASYEFVAKFVDRIARGFARALTNAKRDAEVRADVEIDDEAAWFSATMLGFFVLLRSQIDAEVLRRAGRAAQRHLDSLRPGPATLRR